MEEINRSLEVSKLLKEIMSLIKHNMHKGFEDIGITAPQGMVIGILSKFGKMKISELSSKLGLSTSTVSGIIDRLEKQEMVERERSSEDKRVVYVNLCKKFEDMHRDFHKQVEENIQKMINKGTPEDIDRIMDGFNTLKRLLSRQEH